MEDSEILALFAARDVKAIEATEQKYGAYCMRIAQNILYAAEDAEECVNDVWMNLWNAIPPDKPECLKAYVAKAARNAALDRLRFLSAQKRGSSSTDALLAELEGCLAGSPSPEEEYAAEELKRLINRFLARLSARDRGIFMQRYFFAESTAYIAQRYGLRETNVRLILSRTRNGLKKYLKTEGYE